MEKSNMPFRDRLYAHALELVAYGIGGIAIYSRASRSNISERIDNGNPVYDINIASLSALEATLACAGMATAVLAAHCMNRSLRNSGVRN